MKKIKGPFWSPSVQPVQPVPPVQPVQPHQKHKPLKYYKRNSLKMTGTNKNQK